MFGDEQSAMAAMDGALRAEWVAADPHDDAGEPMPYPGDPVQACDLLARLYSDGSYGRWEITSHRVTVPDRTASCS